MALAKSTYPLSCRPLFKIWKKLLQTTKRKNLCQLQKAGDYLYSLDIMASLFIISYKSEQVRILKTVCEPVRFFYVYDMFSSSHRSKRMRVTIPSGSRRSTSLECSHLIGASSSCACLTMARSSSLLSTSRT